MEKTVFSLQISRAAWLPVPTFISIYPVKTKLQNTLFHRPTCFNLRVAGLHGPFSPRTPSPSTFFYDVSCFSVIKHTDLSSWNFIHYFNLSAQRISTNRLSSKREAGLVCFNVRFRHWKLLIELTKTTRNAEGGKNIKKEKKKKKTRKEMPTIKMSSNEV